MAQNTARKENHEGRRQDQVDRPAPRRQNKQRTQSGQGPQSNQDIGAAGSAVGSLLTQVDASRSGADKSRQSWASDQRGQGVAAPADKQNFTRGLEGPAANLVPAIENGDQEQNEPTRGLGGRAANLVPAIENGDQEQNEPSGYQARRCEPALLEPCIRNVRTMIETNIDSSFESLKIGIDAGERYLTLGSMPESALSAFGNSLAFNLTKIGVKVFGGVWGDVVTGVFDAFMAGSSADKNLGDWKEKADAMAFITELNFVLDNQRRRLKNLWNGDGCVGAQRILQAANRAPEGPAAWLEEFEMAVHDFGKKMPLTAPEATMEVIVQWIQANGRDEHMMEDQSGCAILDFDLDSPGPGFSGRGYTLRNARLNAPQADAIIQAVNTHEKLQTARPLRNVGDIPFRTKIRVWGYSSEDKFFMSEALLGPNNEIVRVRMDEAAMRIHDQWTNGALITASDPQLLLFPFEWKHFKS